jgi:hypothetical protein
VSQSVSDVPLEISPMKVCHFGGWLAIVGAISASLGADTASSGETIFGDGGMDQSGEGEYDTR